MKKLLIVLIAIALTIVIVIRVYSTIQKDNAVSTEVSYVAVEGEAVQTGSIADYSVVTGTVSAIKSVSILPTMPAMVEKINVMVGDRVTEGEQLFQLNGDTIENSVTQADTGVKTASASVEQAQLGISNAQITAKQAALAYDLALANYNANMEKYQFSVDNLAKYKELYEAGVVSEMEYEQMKLQASESTVVLLQKQLEQAEQSKIQASNAIGNANIALKQAQAGLSQAQSGQSQAEDALDDMTFTAPISGVISAVNLVEDAYASNAQAAVVVEDIDQIKISISVTESIVNKIKRGDTVEATFSAMDDLAYKGTILTISPAANIRTLLYEVEIVVENQDHLIKPGMFANINLRTQVVENTMFVKGDAIFYQDGRTFVYVQKGDANVEIRNVTIGIDNGLQVEVLSGLTAEDVYIYSGVGFLDEDTSIKMIRGDL